MIRITALFLFCIGLFSCDGLGGFGGNDQKQQDKKEMKYSYSCLDTTLGGGRIGRKLGQAGDALRDLAVSEDKVTDSVQTLYGNMFHQQMLQEGTFKLMADPALNRTLSNVMQKLLAARDEPSNIRYSIYALNDSAVNAFTFGGRIYITKAMLQKCKGNEALLHAIVGHEIGHSEMGHIRATIQELMLSNKVFGNRAGSTVYGIKQFLTASFNQKNELEADYYGINLTNELGYDVCTAVTFWKEMASRENRYSQVEDFFRTHPFSDLRANCLTDHIRTNFNKNCGGFNKAASHPQVLDR